MKIISYSLFGYGKEKHANCFNFDSYLRGLMLCVRVNRLIYPKWVTNVCVDKSTYDKYADFFDFMKRKKLLLFSIEEDNTPLTLAMLWRLKPLFYVDNEGKRPDRVLCRDLDSMSTYREAQCVQEWINEGRAIHCITDSISHTIPMLGGMIGFIPSLVLGVLGIGGWNDLIAYSDQDFAVKGADQNFLNKFIYPKLLNSSTEHFIKGMPWNLKEEEGRHYRVPDIELDVKPEYKELNEVCGHIGAAGWYDIKLIDFLKKYDEYKNEYRDIENKYRDIFYWWDM